MSHAIIFSTGLATGAVIGMMGALTGRYRISWRVGIAGVVASMVFSGGMYAIADLISRRF